MHELALFAGAGGGILGGYLLGWKTICAVEIDKYPRDVLLARQRDGILDRFPIWDDITTFDGRPWKGRVDIISGGFPCQDISVAGKGAGITGEKSGLWGEMRRVVCEVEPGFVFVENSPALTLRGLGTVLSDLAEMGYNARWCVLGADDAGAPHRRKRIWILAYTDGCRLKAGEPSKSQKKKINMSELFDIEWWDIDPAELPDTDKQHDDMGGFGAGEILQQEQAGIQGCEISNLASERFQNRATKKTIQKKRSKEFKRHLGERENWPSQSRVGRVVDGVANRVGQLKAIGNGQVPAVEALAFVILSEGLI